MPFKMSSAICLNLDQAKILSFGNELKTNTNRVKSMNIVMLRLVVHLQTVQSIFKANILILIHLFEG